MSESNVGTVGRAHALRMLAAVPDVPLGGLAAQAIAIAAITAMLLSVAIWNGFPLTFYDTGGYILQGMASVFVPERAPVYSYFLFLGGGQKSLWLIAVIQSAIVAFTIVTFARIEAPRTSLLQMLGIGAFLAVFTNIAWTAGEIEPDCFTAVLVLGFWLLAFRAPQLGVVRGVALLAFTALAIGAHPSHLALSLSLIAILAALRAASLLPRLRERLPDVRVTLPATAFVLAIAMVLASNYVITRTFFISRSGAVFMTARMIEDGVARRVLDDTCPASGFKLCRFKDSLPPTADHYLWDPDSPFNQLGRFAGTAKESQAIMLEGFERYPMLELGQMLKNGARQFLMFRTGDGVAPQEWVLNAEFRNFLPSQMKAYTMAKQQRGLFSFVLLNILHVGTAALALFVLGVVTWNGRRDWKEIALPAFVLTALLANAFVCGALSGPHDRYQGRLVWVAVLVMILTAWPALLALRRTAESGT